jgi:hypothetical protein
MHRIGRDSPSLDDLKVMSKKYYSEYLPKAKKEYTHMKYPSDDKIEQNDVVIFVFGEIDIRNHYAKQIEKGRNQHEILGSLVNGYIEAILQDKSKYNNVKFGVQSVNPPVDEKNLKESIKEYPIEGTIQQRIEATQLINRLLKEKCEQNNLLFIDTNTYYQNDESLYPKNGLATECKLYELDNRIKDSNVHIHIENPEGIEYALKVVDLPVNITFYEYTKKCKYPTQLNKFQRDTYLSIRLAHYVQMVLMLACVFVPVKYILFSVGVWISLLIHNLIIGRGYDCWYNVIEFRLGNCNNYSTIDSIRLWPREYSNVIVKSIYVISLTILSIKTYMFFYNSVPPFIPKKYTKFIM